MKLRFTIRDLLWLTLVVALFLGMGMGWYKSNRRIMDQLMETNRKHLKEQEENHSLRQQINQLKSNQVQPTK